MHKVVHEYAFCPSCNYNCKLDDKGNPPDICPACGAGGDPRRNNLLRSLMSPIMKTGDTIAREQSITDSLNEALLRGGGS